MKAEPFVLMLGSAFTCAGALSLLFSKTWARKAVEQHRRWFSRLYPNRLESPSTEAVTRIGYIILGLFWIVFGILTMLGKTIK
jgi:hypothetical protein